MLLLLLTSFLGLPGCAVSSAENNRVPDIAETIPVSSEARQPVMVELFTSEGCSSCPPADRQLIFLEKQQPVTQAEIITLAFHVDYWNQLGWKDEYSTAAYSDRQRTYASKFESDQVYTPQMVVDGSAEFVGSNGEKASKAITNAVKVEKGKVEASVTGDDLKVSISGLPKHGAARVFLAIAEDGIVTDVKRGENAGNKLPHISIVRELKEIAAVDAGEVSKIAEVKIQTLPAWNRGNLKFIVFVQEDESRKVIAVGKASR